MIQTLCLFSPRHDSCPQRANRDHFSQFVLTDFDLYLRYKALPFCHGNHVEIQALSEMYNRQIEVYAYDAGMGLLYNSDYVVADTPAQQSQSTRFRAIFMRMLPSAYPTTTTATTTPCLILLTPRLVLVWALATSILEQLIKRGWHRPGKLQLQKRLREI
jgi:hypothetical protein